MDPITSAAPVPKPPAEGEPPLAILVDYDGTVALTDVSDSVMADIVTGEWEELAARYDAGLMGSRRLMEREIELLAADEASLKATAAAQPHDPGFRRFADRARAAGVSVEIVSDGFGFFIRPALATLGLADLPVITAETTFLDGQARIEFPNGHPRCFVCGTCKRERVLAHQRAGRAVVFVGDGESDRYAAGYADVVFAKRALVTICVDNGWPFHRWTEFAEIDAWLMRLLDAWRADPPSVPAPGSGRRPYFCGPEVWGEGRWDPPAPAGRPVDLDEGIVPG
jgi:2-hydroxy-3-keto-5-methylthiopentenyl-1-phosphate phosphatase